MAFRFSRSCRLSSALRRFSTSRVRLANVFWFLAMVCLTLIERPLRASCSFAKEETMFVKCKKPTLSVGFPRLKRLVSN